jgi:hypothetical protein
MRTAYVLLAALFLGACGGPVETDPRLGPLTQATLEPGVGLGDVRLGETKLGPFVERFGHGQVGVIVSDEAGIEITLAQGQMSFLFGIERDLMRQMESPSLKFAAQDLGAFLGAYPACRDLPLISLTVAEARTTEGTLYRGSLPSGVKLHDSLFTITQQHGTPERTRSGFVAGMSPNLGIAHRFEDVPGLLVYFERAKSMDGTVREKVSRMTVFLPRGA